jgi:spore maturation protein CgeB
MNILYIGQYTNGTTSKMRADQLKELLPGNIEIIDTHHPFFQTSKLWRSIGFRFKKGPLIKKINNYVVRKIENAPVKKFDLIWVDKAVFLTSKTTKLFKKKTKRIVHFTPDMAFFQNKSQHFIQSLPNYSITITTKTIEIPFYNKLKASNQLITTTQGYNPSVHRPYNNFSDKTKDIAFIGLAEPSRFKIIEKLINAGISVKIAGKGWQKFVLKHQKNRNLKFFGEALYNEDYARFISSSLFSVGLLSKKFPELHTTRTFEIPACGTALITERNTETTSFFNENEAIFYDSVEEIIEKIKYYQAHKQELEDLTKKGRERVIKDGRDYRSILKGILKEIEKRG